MKPVDDLILDIIPIIKNAGLKLTSLFKNEKLAFSFKKSGLVTQADILSEEYLIEHLSKLIPGCSFICEESGVSGQSDYSFIIDPLDGTTNFVHGIPYFCVSVALTYKKEPVLAFIYEPIGDELFFAASGRGAYLNGKPISVGRATSISKAVITTSNFLKERDIALRKSIEKIGKKAYSLRHLGSIALDSAYVAIGRLDGLILTKFSTWDIAASWLLLHEAGAMVTDRYNKEFNLDKLSLVGANKELHKEIIQHLSQ